MTTFGELLAKHTSDEQIIHRLVELYPDQAGNGGYGPALANLRTVTPTTSDWSIVLADYLDDGKPVVDVSGYDSDGDGPLGVSYTPWREWLASPISPATLTSFTELDILAHCLWEMTWIAFDDETVDERAAEILAIADEDMAADNFVEVQRPS